MKYTPPNTSSQKIDLPISYNTSYIIETSYNTGEDWQNPLTCYDVKLTDFRLTTKSTWSTQSKIAILMIGY